jgi:hypothetical protein
MAEDIVNASLALLQLAENVNQLTGDMDKIIDFQQCSASHVETVLDETKHT